MTSTDIYSILQSKPHNQHYLNRYWKFIQYCQQNPSNDEYLEEHHICPKASDMFPEYTSFRLHPWNKIRLNMERHLLAHLLLWKTYLNSSQQYCMHYMVNVAGDKKNIPGKFVRQYSMKLKLEAWKQRIGFSTYKDIDGKRYFLHESDSIIKTMNLVGVNSGIKFSDESRENLRRSKDANRKITLYFMMFERAVNINSDEMSVLIDYGWTPYMQQERLDAKKEKAKQGAKKAMLGKNRFYYQDGTYYGMLEESDPLVVELNLVHIRSEKQQAQASVQARKNAQNEEMQIRKGKTMSKLKWFHDPITKENKRLLICPAGWKEGRTEQETSNKGRETWNDGVRNYMLSAGEVPESSWVRGMSPRKKK